MKVAAIQHDIEWEEPARNLERLAPLVRRSAEEGAQLILLPELFACGFTMNVERVAEHPGGPTTSFLGDLARETGALVGGSLPELVGDDPRPFNTFVVAGPAGEEYRYRKRHPFTPAGEAEAYRRGDELVTVELAGLRCTLFVCYDLRFADDFWTRAEETDAYLVIANWPEARREHWRTLLRARAIENQAHVIGLNRVGEGGGVRYAGDSVMVAPDGEVLAEAAGEETTLLADIDPARVARWRAELPFVRDRPAP